MGFGDVPDDALAQALALAVLGGVVGVFGFEEQTPAVRPGLDGDAPPVRRQGADGFDGVVQEVGENAAQLPVGEARGFGDVQGRFQGDVFPAAEGGLVGQDGVDHGVGAEVDGFRGGQAVGEVPELVGQAVVVFLFQEGQAHGQLVLVVVSQAGHGPLFLLEDVVFHHLAVFLILHDLELSLQLGLFGGVRHGF